MTLRSDYKKVSFHAGEIRPDAPEGEWRGVIPRGKCKVKPTQKDGWPMLIVPVKLTEAAEPENDSYIGSEVAAMIVFFGDDQGRKANLSKARLAGLCKAVGVDLDAVPTEIGGPDDLAEFIDLIEGRNLTVYTRHQTRKDTGETTVEVLFSRPANGNGTLLRSTDE